MVRLVLRIGLLLCLIFICTTVTPGSHAHEHDVSKLDIHHRKAACRQLSGRCVKRKKACPENLPLEKKRGKPYCKKRKRCCYPGINECEVNNGGCEHTCTDTVESFRCSCLDNYFLDNDGSSCIADFEIIPWCLVNTACTRNETRLINKLKEFPRNYYKEPVRSSLNDPRSNDIEFRLYNSTSNKYTLLITNKESSVNASTLNPSLPLLVIAHGFKENATTSVWMNDTKNEWLKKKQMNVILVQWSKLANISDYCQAVNNTKFAGTELARLLNFLQNFTGLSPSDTHIIGFSLGAQLAGVAGHHLHNLSRITGLDPAGPGFYDSDPSERLEQSDANFVDVIHANGGCIEAGHLGYFFPCGHVDFYMNGGSFQNGCPPHTFDYCISHPEKCFSLDSLACSHRRAHEYYIESLTAPEPSYGYLCNKNYTFQDGLCLKNESNIVGYGVIPNPAGVYYINTLAQSPFLTRSILIQLLIGGNDEKYHGEAYIGPILPNRTEETVDMMGDYDGVPSGTNLTKLISVPSGTKLTSIQISAMYKENPLIGLNHIVADNIEAFDAYEKAWYCVNGPITLYNEERQIFTPKPGKC